MNFRLVSLLTLFGFSFAASCMPGTKCADMGAVAQDGAMQVALNDEDINPNCVIYKPEKYNLEIIQGENCHDSDSFSFKIKPDVQLNAGDKVNFSIVFNSLSSKYAKMGNQFLFTASNIPESKITYQINPFFGVVYVYTTVGSDYKDTVFTFKTLGAVNNAQFTKNDNTVTVSYGNDIIRTNPVSFEYTTDQPKPMDYSLPNNINNSLMSILKALQANAQANAVANKDIIRMSIASFVNNIRHVIHSNSHIKPASCTDFGNFCEAFTTCVESLSYYEDCHKDQNKPETKPVSWDCNRPLHLMPEGCDVVNVEVRTEANILFNEYIPTFGYNKKSAKRPCIKPSYRF